MLGSDEVDMYDPAVVNEAKGKVKLMDEFE